MSARKWTVENSEGGGFYIINQNGRCLTYTDSTADVPVIAAAPELLEALQELVSLRVVEMFVPAHEYQRIKDLIRRAGGRA